MQELRINFSVRSPPVTITLKHFLSNLSLQALLNLRGTWNRLLSSLHHYQLQWICNNRIYSAVQNALFVGLHIPLLLIYPVTLFQDRHTYRHDLVIQSAIPPNVMVIPFRPDIVIYNTTTSSLQLFELTCPLDSAHDLVQARSRMQ